ncbi:hypothetical protein N8692_04985, partial [Flavobacteriales bacterium]|nr:hypothetical protein [Flavobacteriales bacterium]
MQTNISADDVHSNILPIGFPFTFYGNTYSNCVLSSNNYLTFDISQANQYSPYSITVPIPNPGSLPENAIMCPWQDINPAIGGIIEYGNYGSSPNRVFIARWNNVPMYSCTSLTFNSHLYLFESSNIIETHVIDKQICTSFNGGQAVHGLVDVSSSNYNIVNDPFLFTPRNFPLQWSASSDAWQF